jgi:N-acetylmuramate 1-kinase
MRGFCIGLTPMPDRKAQSDSFLRAQGWGGATRRFLAGDASDRSYDRLVRGADRAVLMDAPPGQGDDPGVFVAVAAHLQGIGLSVPHVLGHDLGQGFLLLEDLGDAVFARVLDVAPQDEPLLYTTAVDALLCLQTAPHMPGLPDLAAHDWAAAALFALDWYGSGITGQPVDHAPLFETLAEALSCHADGPRVMIHRDYHAENLIWLPDRVAYRRAGILDFQLLQMGQPVYDLVSLLQDARRDVGIATVAHMRQHILGATGQSAHAFDLACAVIGVQRALRIIGIFARLCLMSAKPGYLGLIPRVWQHLQTNLAHPALADLRAICDRYLPVPSATNLILLREKCGTVPA